MKIVLATALVAAVSAMNMNNMLPFLMMDSMGNQYYQDANGNLIPMMMAMGGNKIFKGNNAMLPLMMSGSNISPTTAMMMAGPKMFKGNNAMLPFLMDGFGGGAYYYSNNGILGGNPMIAATALGQRPRAGRALSTEQILLMNGGLTGGISDPTTLLTLAGNKRYDFGTAVALGADIPTMAAAGNLRGLSVSPKDMSLPFVVDAMADGRQASLSKDVIPAMAMMGQKINMQSILPWMMTSGQRYLGEMGPAIAMMGGNTLKKAFSADNLMPWLLQDFGAPSYYYSAAPAYTPIVHAPRAAPVLHAGAHAAPMLGGIHRPAVVYGGLRAAAAAPVAAAPSAGYP